MLNKYLLKELFDRLDVGSDGRSERASALPGAQLVWCRELGVCGRLSDGSPEGGMDRMGTTALEPWAPPEGGPIPAEAWDILTRRSSQGPVYLLGSLYLASPGTPGETWSMRWGAPGTSHSKALGSRKAGSQNPAESQGHTLSEQAD